MYCMMYYTWHVHATSYLGSLYVLKCRAYHLVDHVACGLVVEGCGSNLWCMREEVAPDSYSGVVGLLIANCTLHVLV